MASTINATTSSGIVATADNTGQLALQANGTTVMTVTSTGVTTQVGAPAFGAYGPAGTMQSLTTNTVTKVQINTENFDTNSNFDTSNYRFTPTVAGYYQVTGQVYYSGSGITGAQARLHKNGNLFRSGTPILCSSTSDIVALVSTLVYMNGSTDYLELYARGTFSGATSVSGADTDTYFQAFLARSA